MLVAWQVPCQQAASDNMLCMRVQGGTTSHANLNASPGVREAYALT